MEVFQGFGRSYIDIGNGLGIEKKPAHSLGALLNELVNAFGEATRIRKEQRCIETISNQTGKRLLLSVSQIMKTVARDGAQNSIGRVRDTTNETQQRESDTENDSRHYAGGKHTQSSQPCDDGASWIIAVDARHNTELDQAKPSVNQNGSESDLW